MNPYEDSAALRQDIASESDGDVILSFSRGKDSLATWLALRKTFHTVRPFYMERIPGLVFVQESLDYFERFFGCKIPVLPHPATYRQLRAYVFQPPERWPVIEDAIKAGRLPAIDYAGQEAIVRGWAGRDLPVAWGTRATDSPIRMANVRKHGPRNHQRGAFWAIYDWRMADVLAEIKASGVKLPVDYRMFGRSMDGIDWRYLAPLKRRYPEDYRRVLELFPLAELELYRRRSCKMPIDAPASEWAALAEDP